MILPDLLKENLDIVFCDTAAGYKSAQRKAYYAGTGNLFYPTLAKCSLILRIVKPEEYSELLKYKIGLTDLIKHHLGMDIDLKEEFYDTGSFEKKIKKYQPKLLCFNGKEAAKVYFKLKSTTQVSYGLQEAKIGKTKLYVAPSTSLNARGYWDENIWQSIKKYI